MKPEPLKGKLIGVKLSLSTEANAIFIPDVRSAVEYLKQEIKAITFDHTDKHKECDLTFESVAVDRVLRKINEAFEDVVKPTEGHKEKA